MNTIILLEYDRLVIIKAILHKSITQTATFPYLKKNVFVMVFSEEGPLLAQQDLGHSGASFKIKWCWRPRENFILFFKIN